MINYDIILEFTEGENNALGEFVHVKIFANGKSVCDELLDTVLKSGSIVLPENFLSGKTMDLKIIYYINEDVGNEAENATADFELLITASNE